MSTRGAIGRLVSLNPVRFHARYHHWDGYPNGLGRTLYRLYNGRFDHDVEAMLKFLIDEHPAGWSTINGDAFECYCHTNGSEKAWTVTHKNATASGVEYAYVFPANQNKMLVLSSFCPDGAKMIGMFGAGDPDAIWRIIAEVDLNGPEPDWKSMESDDE